MNDLYIMCNRKLGYWKLRTDNEIITTFLSRKTFQEIDLENISESELRELQINIPVISDKQLFESSKMKEGFTLKSIRWGSIRYANRLRFA